MWLRVNNMFFFLKRTMARAKNDAGERIESLRFSVPALRVGVLEYGAGQLQTNNTALDGKTVKLYYPPEAVSDKDFLKSLETAPVIVGGHDSTTNEQNKKIDGWAHNVSYDASKKAAMIDGVVKGAKEVAYIRGNLGTDGFGASAFVDIYNLKVENGVTPDGQEYNAIANELRATHVALAPHVRDPENKIKVVNAVCINTEGSVVEEKTEAKNTTEEKHVNTINIDPVAFSAAVKNAVKEIKTSARNMKTDAELREIWKKSQSDPDILPNFQSPKYGLSKDEEKRMLKIAGVDTARFMHKMGQDRAKQIAADRDALRGKR